MSNHLKITEKAWIKVTKHVNGFYTQLIYNNGHNAGEIFISETEEKAFKIAEKIKAEYLK